MNKVSRAVDNYSRETYEAITPPTRDEAQALRVEVLRSVLLNLVVDALSETEAQQKKLGARARDLGRLKAALDLVTPMMEVTDDTGGEA